MRTQTLILWPWAAADEDETGGTGGDGDLLVLFLRPAMVLPGVGAAVDTTLSLLLPREQKK